jgi:eukaryotic-like serine/threonine-protein kinase
MASSGGPALDQLFVDFQAALAGRYSLEREVGRGGMGVVYLAREVRLDRPVAIKLLPPARAKDAALRERFLREARTAAKLSHPNIIPIFSVDEADEFVFFAMAYVDGETLTNRVRERGPVPPSEAARLLREVAWALAYAHSQGLVHRDVKPDNIILEAGTGRALIADFGIAGAVKGAAGLDGAVIGTPEFMSPEQALGEAIDGRSDLYALGLVGYFALTGKMAYAGGTATEVLARQVTEPPPTVAGHGVPRKVAQAVERCLAKDPAERHQSGEDLAELLSVALERRKEIPVALRAFVKHNGRLDGSGVLLYPFGLLLASGVVGSVFGTGAAFLTLIGGLTLAPMGVLINRARRLLKTGFGHGDLGVAFRAEIEQGREERAVEGGHGPSLLERILRPFAAVGLTVSGALFPLVVFGPSVVSAGVFTVFAVGGTVGFSTGVWSLVLLQRRRDVDGEFWARVWAGRFGRWLFGVARSFVPAGALPAAMTHRPTELSIGMAAEQLYAQLPKETRAHLRELPDVVHRLEEDARLMRERLEELQEAGIGEGKSGKATGAIDVRRDRIAADLSAERELVQQRLADAVAALETIRLNLLRLHAGTASVQSVTTDLGLAKDVAREVDLLLQSRKELDDFLKK